MMPTYALLVMFELAVAANPPTAPLWDDFVAAQAQEQAAILPDFSYAGYHFSARPLPKLADRPRFDVTDFGAIANDKRHDDAAIQAAIDAAEAAGGGVVYFPPGRFLLSADSDTEKCLRISHDGVVLQGRGSAEGGTEVFLDQMRVASHQIRFGSRHYPGVALATIVGDAPRESFQIEVDDASRLRVGQNVVLCHRSEAFTRRYFDPLPLAPEWTRLVGQDGGMEIAEIHTIAAIKGRRVRFRNPIHFDLRLVPDQPFTLHQYQSLRECGLEGIRFTSNWKNYPAEFVHHQDAIHDSGWNAVSMEYVEDSWIRDCEFRDVNECVFARAAYKVTFENLAFTGKRGHTSIHARSGYGVLIKNCHFNGSHHHGPGDGYGAVNTVVTQCSMGVDQNIDSHSGQPMATLFDDVEGGVFSNCGGPWPGLPHHGRDLVFWNFRHRSTYDYHYDFWNANERRNHTFAQPIFVGFQADRKISFVNEGINQSPGDFVEPRSLFEAQLQLRLRREEQSASENTGGLLK
jgi:hypothetical protein